MLGKSTRMPTAAEALPGRPERMPIPAAHHVNGRPIAPPFPSNTQAAVFGMGCFWGAERKFWTVAGVWTTAVGYAAGLTPNPTYREVCSGATGHNEVVLVVFEPAVTSYRDGMGNRVDLFNVAKPYTELVILATSYIRTHRRPGVARQRGKRPNPDHR